MWADARRAAIEIVVKGSDHCHCELVSNLVAGRCLL